MHLRLARFGWLGALWLAGIACGQDVATLREHLAKLSPQEKEEFLRKQQRFYALPEEQQQKLRQLHREITEAPDCRELEQVLHRYHQWLKTLQPGERAELLSLPPERRIERIKQLLEAQELHRFRQLTKATFNDNDIRQIFDWLREYTKTHEKELLAIMPAERRKSYEERSDDLRYRGWLLTSTLLEQDVTQLRISSEEVADLLSRLSPPARKLLPPETDPQQRNRLIRAWIDVALVSLFPRGPRSSVSQDELTHFVEKELSDRDRAYLEGLPAEAFRREAERLYYYYKYREGGPGRGRGRGPFPPGRRGGTPEGDKTPPR
ncbi:MAG: hypothetical protein KatS3mg110_1477 [Pirellulaceae bacterium]|nr:MAG: hypothetical protein KatS3mg110_1477 [Pirellulaceae bacterium]